VLKDNTRWLTKKVNEKLPDGSVTEELIGKWLRDAFSDPVVSSLLVPAGPAISPNLASTQAGPGSEPVTTPPEPKPETVEPVSRRIGLSDLLSARLLFPHDDLVIEGPEGRRQTAAITPDGKIVVAGQVFDAVSPAALRALELAGKPRKAVNGWAAFRVLRAGNAVGTLLEIRGQYEDREAEASPAEAVPDAGTPVPDGGDSTLDSAVDQMKPLLALLPELRVHASKASISLYAGTLVVGYAYPRKKGLPRLRAKRVACLKWRGCESRSS
jgi:hypothetical protein